MGCGYEGANRKYVAINIPPLLPLSGVQNFLSEMGANWENADPTYEQLHPDDPLNES